MIKLKRIPSRDTSAGKWKIIFYRADNKEVRKFFGNRESEVSQACRRALEILPKDRKLKRKNLKL
jgi:hypothetical protein